MSDVMLVAPPPVLTAIVRALVRLPARSRVRRKLLIEIVLAGFDVLNLREIDRLLQLYDASCEIRLGPGWPVDLEPVQHGHAAARRIISAWDEVGAVSFMPVVILDMGGPAFAVLASVAMTGATSGVNPEPIRAVWSFTIDRGKIVVQAMRNDGWESGPGELREALMRAPGYRRTG